MSAPNLVRPPQSGDGGTPSASPERARAGLESAAALVVGLDLEGRVTFLNAAALAAVGGDAAGWIGRDWFAAAIPSELRPEAREEFSRILAGGPTRTVEHRVPTPRGEERIIAWRGSPGATPGESAAVLLVGIDTTEQRHVEAVRRDGDERFRRVVECSPDAIFIQTHGRFAYANAATLRLFGANSVSDLLGRPVLDQLAPECRERTAARIRRLNIDREPVEQLEQIFLRLDGTRVTAEVSGVPFVFAGEAGALVFARDITTRLQAEARLHRSEATLEAALASMSDAVFISDAAGNFVAFNEAFATFHRFKDKSACARSLAAYHDLVEVYLPNGEFVPHDFWTVPRALRGEQVTGAEYTLRHRHTGETWVGSYSFGPIRDPQGQIVGSVVVGREITAEKREANSLKAAEARLRLSVDSSNIGLWDWDPMTNAVSFSAVWKRQIGYAAHEIPDQLEEWRKRVHPDDLASVEARLQAYLADPTTDYLAEFRFRHKDGSYRWIFTRAQLLHNARGQAVRMLGCHVDITETKQAEQAISESRETLRALLARLQEAREQERIRISREIHDELGQVLTALKMDTRWLERKLSATDSPPGKAVLIDRAVAATAMADRAIASVQRIAAKLRPVALDQLGLVACVRQQALQFQDRTAIPCSVQASPTWPNLPAGVTTDVFYIVQEALTNIARHAQATQVEIHLQEEPPGLTVDIRDNGVGLSGIRLNSPQSLGLTGMQERALQCGGAIEFQRGDPTGTTVRVRLPLAPAG